MGEGSSRELAAPLVGRERERTRLARAVTGASTTPTTSIVLRGEPGIGKSALWTWAISEHRAAGHTVLVTRAFEDEWHAPLTALVDLLEAVDHDPAALDPRSDVSERGRAVAATLRRLAAERPVIVAIDNLQWLDGASHRALRFALRRLDGSPVSVVATERRTGERVELLPSDRTEDLDVGPLAPAEIDAIVRAAVGPLPKPSLERVRELSGGNPLFAIELAHATPDRPSTAVPVTLRTTLSARLETVPERPRTVLRTAAALGPVTAEVLTASCPDVPDAASAVADAVALGVLVNGDDGQLRFAHPLLASVVLDETNPVERLALHARLAELATDPDRRARHLAQGWVGRDAAVAAELEAAAERAARLGAATIAADLAQHSARVTPEVDRDDRSRRVLASITSRAAAGEPERAVVMADELLDSEPSRPYRIEAATHRVFLDIDDGEAFLGRALADAGDDHRWRGRLLELLGWLLGTYRGRLAEAVTLGDEAIDIARAHDDPELEMVAAATASTSAALSGRRSGELIERAMELAERHEPPRLGRWPQLFKARQALWGGDLDEARRQFESMRRMFAHRGIEFQRPYRLSDLAWLEVAAGNLREAWELADDALAAALDAGNPQAVAWRGYPAALACAHLGRTGDATDLAGALDRWGADHDQPPRRMMAAHVRGIGALARGDAASATTDLDLAVALATELGYRHPGYVPALPDAIEAHTLAGDHSTARRLAEELDAQSEDLGEPWVAAAARRGRGLVLLASGDRNAADELAAAADSFDTMGYRLDSARARALVGLALRRDGRRTAATDALAAAHAQLVDMGAEPWARSVASHLGRAAGRRGATAPASTQLTATEERIAELVARGLRNREIAGELIVSVATVEAHLTRIYRKVGVRSRTELARTVRHLG